MTEAITKHYDPCELSLKRFETEVLPAIKAGARVDCVVLEKPYSLISQDLINLTEAYGGPTSPAASTLVLNETWQGLMAARGPIKVTMASGEVYSFI